MPHVSGLAEGRGCARPRPGRGQLDSRNDGPHPQGAHRRDLRSPHDAGAERGDDGEAESDLERRGAPHGYTQFQASPDQTAADFLGATPEIGVTIQPPLIQVRDLLGGPNLLMPETTSSGPTTPRAWCTPALASHSTRWASPRSSRRRRRGSPPTRRARSTPTTPAMSSAYTALASSRYWRAPRGRIRARAARS